ncbi:abscisic acid receptor PYL8 [Trifolium repens]|nr:abscisic acid receptor PYL8 [Trifolium repens]
MQDNEPLMKALSKLIYLNNPEMVLYWNSLQNTSWTVALVYGFFKQAGCHSLPVFLSTSSHKSHINWDHMDISVYCNEILNLALAYLSYDPNFTNNMEEDTDDEGHEEEEDDESANEYTDDEDASWKVRIAAAKCLAALIISRPELLSKVFDEVWFLMRRFDQPQKYKPFISRCVVRENLEIGSL